MSDLHPHEAGMKSDVERKDFVNGSSTFVHQRAIANLVKVSSDPSDTRPRARSVKKLNKLHNNGMKFKPIFIAMTGNFLLFISYPVAIVFALKLVCCV